MKRKQIVGLLVVGICLLMSSNASAYHFTKGNDKDLQVHFDTYIPFSSYPEDAKLTYDYQMAFKAAEEGQAYADENGIDLDGRTPENIRDEIMFHARAYYFPLDIPFKKKADGSWKRSHEAANPADIGKGDQYWTPIGPKKILKK